MANGGEQPERPASVTGTRQKPQVTLGMPSRTRHDPDGIAARGKSRKGDRNTMIEPWVDVRADIDAINRGEAIVDRERATAWIHGRLWGFHTDTGTAYPISGTGFISLTQAQHSALRMIAGYTHLNEDAERELRMRPSLTDEDREIVRYVWRLRRQLGD